MKKLICLFLLLITLLQLFACKNINSSGNKTVTLQYWTFDELYKKNMEDLIELYNLSSDVHLELETRIFSMDELDYKLWASLQAGLNPPDIIDLEQSRFGRYMNPKNNYLTPLNTIIDAHKQEIISPAYEKYREKGFYYGLDYSENNCVVFYNHSLLNSAGIDPASIKSMDDMFAAGELLRQQKGIPLLAIDYTDDLVYESLLGASGGGYCSSVERSAVTDILSVQTLEMLHDMIFTKNIAVPAPGGDFFSYKFYNYFNSGQVAAVIAPFWYSAFIEAYAPNLAGSIYVAPLPEINGKHTGAKISGIATAIPISSEHSILIKNLMRDTRMNPQSCVDNFHSLFADPIMPSCYNQNMLAEGDKQNQFFYNNSADVLKSIRADSSIPVIGIAYYDIAQKMRSQILFQVLQENSLSPEAALQKAQAELASVTE